MKKSFPAPPPPVPRGPRPKPETIKATELVLEGGWPILTAAKHCGVSHTAVIKRIKSLKEGRNIHK